MLMFSLRRSLLTAALLLATTLSVLARDPVPVALPATPDGTIKAIGTAMGEGKFEVIWQAMPASYQADIKKLLVEFSKKMDADLWAQGSKVAGKLTKLLTDKADFIVGNQMIAQQLQAKAVKPEDVKIFITGFGGILTELQTNMATLPDVEKLDVEKMLANLGPRAKELSDVSERLGVAAQGPKMIDLVKIDAKLISSASDTATVEIIKPDATKETVELVRVEGKWVPKDMADQWASKIGEAQKALAAMQIKPEEKQQAIMITGMASGMLDGFLNAKTQQEFDASIQALLPLISGALPGQGPQPKGAPNF